LPCSIKKMLIKADQVVQPYLKSLQHFKFAESPVIQRLLAVLPARFRGDAQSGKVASASPTKRVALRAAAPPHTRSAPRLPSPATKQDSKLLPKTPPALPPPSPMIPELKLAKLLAAQAAITEESSPEKSEMVKVGEDMARSMGDLFSNIGGSMDNLFQGDAVKPKPRPQRGTIVA
jgi:hypothetical protein